MSTEWLNLPTMADVTRAQAEGWEIEHAPGFNASIWSPWKGLSWNADRPFRGRPVQPKMKKIKMHAWLIRGSFLDWWIEGASPSNQGVRVPSEDKEIEVPE